MKKLLIFGLLIFGFGMITYLVFKEGSLPVNKKDTSYKRFVIEKGATVDSIANKLASENLIRSKIVFRFIVRQLGLEKKIQAGSFELSPSYSAEQIAVNLTKGTEDTWLVVPEGLRKEEIAEIVAKNLSVSTDEFKSLAKEGYLYPDSYLVPKLSTAQNIIDLMNKTLTSRYTTEMRDKAKKLGFTDQQVIIIASLVEREAKNDDDRQEVANIIVRRLKEDHPLQIDATVQYVLGYQANEKRWWKAALTYDDLKIESLYNTYKVTGLPPQPISNPGIRSIEAVVNANPKTPYFFYIHEPNGRAHYAKDLEEHEKNVQKYLR